MRLHSIALAMFVLGGVASAQVPATAVNPLVAEAERANPRIRAAEHLWEAARHAVGPASTLPDPQVSLQQVSVGNPLPFAGYETSGFAYTGIGVTQAVPIPGKLRLRGQIAQSGADVRQAELEQVRREVEADVRTTYIQLAYLQAVHSVLLRDQDLLAQISHLAVERYATGQISQAEVLGAQAGQTGVLRDLQSNDQQARIVQAQLRLLLARPANAADIVAEPLRDTAAAEPPPAPTAANDPQLAAQRAVIAGSDSSVALAHKDLTPDFTVGYMYQRTGPGFPDYYQWTLGWSLPIHRSRHQQEALAQAVAEHAAAQEGFAAAAAQDEFARDEQWATAQADEKLIQIYRDGLMPQANARLEASLTAFQSNRGGWQEVLDAYRALADLEQGYWHTLAEHETALVKLRQIAGSAEAGHE